MKKFFRIFLLFIALFLIGCKKEEISFSEVEKYLLEEFNGKVVSGDINLPLESLEHSAKFEWLIDSENLSNEGKFTVPDEDLELNLKVKITIKEESKIINIKFLLKGKVDIFKEVKEEIKNSMPSGAVEEDIKLITSYKDFKIVWKSSDENVITSSGKVKRGDSDVEVSLEATIKSSTNETVSEKYNVVVSKALHSFSEVEEYLLANFDGKEVSGNIVLPKELAEFNAKLVWEIGEDDYLDSDGNFNAPILDTETIIFINIQMNGKNKEFEVFMNLKGWGSEIDVIKEWVKEQVDPVLKSSIRFPVSHNRYPSTLVWKSSNEEVLSNIGEVNKDDFNDTKITLTCEITYNGEKDSVSFEVVVPKKADSEKNFEVRNWLDEKFLGIEEVKGDIDLPKTSPLHNAKITWETNSPGVLSENGKYNTPLFDRIVSLTATSKVGEHTLKVTYNFKTYGAQAENIWENVEKILSYIALEKIETQKYYTFGYQEKYKKNEVINYGYLPFYVNEGANPVVDIIELTHGKNRTGIKKTSTEYIVIHDTGSADPTATAKAHANWLKNMTANEESASWVSWHYTVDENEAIQHVPLDEVAYHAGDGSTTYPNTWSGGLGGGNRNGIGIETCVNYGSDYNQTMRRTAKLVAELLIDFKLGLDRVKQHNDFSGKDCPQTMRHAERWGEFMTLVEIEYFGKTMLNGVNFKWTSLSPDILDNTGRIINHPNKETIVKYQVEVTYKEETKTFTFESVLCNLPE